MQLSPMPNYFVVRIPKKEQEERKEKIGSIYLHSSHVFMERNMQHGEIVAIGEYAHKEFPQAKVGDTLIIHHFIENENQNKNVYTDEGFNYYVVSHEHDTYGIYDGEKIIPYKDYIFLESEKPTKELPLDDAINQQTETVGSLILFKEWKETREQKENRMGKIKNQIQKLCETGMTDEIKKKVGEMEAEMNQISKDLNKKQYSPFIIAYANPKLSSHFNTDVQSGDIIYMLNIACNTKVEFMDKEYRVAKTEFIGLIQEKSKYA